MNGMMDDGQVTFCSLINTAENGSMPVYWLEALQTQYFEERQIGITRAYLAKGADEQIDMLIRIYDEGIRPKIGMYAVLKYYEGQEDADNGDQYRITLVQPTVDDNNLRVYDVQLQRLERNYDADIN